MQKTSLPLRTLAAGFIFLFGSHALATQNNCFLDAETYYEQIYCEIIDKDPGSRLPSFIDFKKNAPNMQALLLMRKAKALGIDLNMPKKEKARSRPEPDTTQQYYRPTNTASCQLKGRQIHCKDELFKQIGNLPNSSLKQDALEEHNRLVLENYRGPSEPSDKLKAHLTEQYIKYLEKMLEIGLGGETMSFTKFYGLFQDMYSKGVDFSKRFETMFQFLKKDKTNIHVRQAIEPLAHIDINNCARLTTVMFTCDNRKRNTIYLKH